MLRTGPRPPEIAVGKPKVGHHEINQTFRHISIMDHIFLSFVLLVALIVSILTLIYQRYQQMEPAKLGGYEPTIELPFGRAAIAVDDLLDVVEEGGIKHNPRGDMYRKYDSNDQIQTIIRKGTSIEVAKLYQLLTKHAWKRGPDALKWFAGLATRRDTDVYTEIQKLWAAESGHNKETRGGGHAQLSWDILKRVAPKSAQYENYLDVGCGDGTITAEFSKLIGAKNVGGLEIGKYDNPAIKYTYITPDTVKLPQDDGTYDLITAYMSLHHIKQLPAIFAELCRVLKPGGIFFIKEHDCWSAMDAMLIDIEHNIFIYGNNETQDRDPHIYHHRNCWSWIKFFEAAGFECLGANYYATTVRPDISPTRAFWAIFCRR